GGFSPSYLPHSWRCSSRISGGTACGWMRSRVPMWPAPRGDGCGPFSARCRNSTPCTICCCGDGRSSVPPRPRCARCPTCSRSRPWGVYPHRFCWWVLLAQLAVVIRRAWPVRAAWRKTVGAQRAVAIAYSPWVLLLATHRPEPQAWKGPATIVFGIPYTLLRFSLGYSEFLANAGWKNRVPELVAGNALLLVVALVVFGVLAVVGWRELWRAGRD